MSARRFLRAAAVLIALLTLLSGCWKKNNQTSESSNSSGNGESGYDLVIYHSRDSCALRCGPSPPPMKPQPERKSVSPMWKTISAERSARRNRALSGLRLRYGDGSETNMKDYSAAEILPPSTQPFRAASRWMPRQGELRFAFEIEGRGYIVDPRCSESFSGSRCHRADRRSQDLRLRRV